MLVGLWHDTTLAFGLQLNSATIMRSVILSMFSMLLEAPGERGIHTTPIVVPWVFFFADALTSW